MATNDGYSAEDRPETNALHLSEWFQRLSRPSFFVRPDTLEIVDMNPSARLMLESGGGLSAVGGRLVLGGKQSTERFRAFVDVMGEGPSAYATGGGSDANHVVLRVEKVPDAGLVAIQTFPTALDDTLWADTGAIFGLTRSEERLLKALMGGANAEELAGSLGISIETVRTHVKRSYAKLGVANREQLFATMASFRLRR
ncbi:MAG: helix-turn-helix transcriptional regulator [Alphaproteobacteria bacterium]|nr:helix-turn-helix transcriptional regulator [Alphaproteobacteria bacterium]MBU2271474.1 helix-turn-helix transcriptional regulator [Alphaproteobacteria bacterium]MBU2418476.1 helix-turn-helix transcriptional regulator [Alphaproteobacteria bacterium]